MKIKEKWKGVEYGYLIAVTGRPNDTRIEEIWTIMKAHKDKNLVNLLRVAEAKIDNENLTF